LTIIIFDLSYSFSAPSISSNTEDSNETSNQSKILAETKSFLGAGKKNDFSFEARWGGTGIKKSPHFGL